MKTTSYRAAAVLAIAVGLSACPGPEASFPGYYTVNGTNTVVLDGNTSSGVDSGNARILAGTTASSIVYPMPGNYSGTCNVPLDVSGNTASVRSGFSCTVTANGMPMTISFQSGTMVDSNGIIEADATATLSAVYNGATYSGTLSFHDTLTLVSR